MVNTSGKPQKTYSLFGLFCLPTRPNKRANSKTFAL